MKKLLVLVLLIVCIGSSLYAFYPQHIKNNQTKSFSASFMEGDIIFQSSESAQCKAVKLATHSEYSHVGMITFVNDKPFVLEAVEPVRKTPLTDWIAHGIGGHYSVMRLKDRSEISTAEIEVGKILAKKMLGLHYDVYFNWSDDQLYCSELVWKVYERAYSIQLCPLRKMKDFDLTSKEVQAVMKQRYGKNPPLEEEVVAPSDLSTSTLLYVVEKK